MDLRNTAIAADPLKGLEGSERLDSGLERDYETAEPALQAPEPETLVALLAALAGGTALHAAAGLAYSADGRGSPAALAWTAAAACTVVLTLRLGLRRRWIPEAYSELVVLGAALAGLISVVRTTATSGEASFAAPLLALPLLASLVFWSFRSFGVFLIACIAGWRLMLDASGSSLRWDAFGTALFASVVVAAVFYAIRLRLQGEQQARLRQRLNDLDELYRSKLTEPRGLASTAALAARGRMEELWEWDLSRDSIRFSERWMEVLGYSTGEIPPGPEGWFNLIHPHDLGPLLEDLTAHLDGKADSVECEHRIRHQGGAYRWVLTRARAVRGEDGKATSIVGSQADLRRIKSAESRMVHDATHDRLTGLPNREYLLSRLRHDIERARRNPSYLFAAVFLDLDRFKDINDSLGHLIGDQLLEEVGRRLADCRRPEDSVGRLGGDEFVVLLRGVRDVEDALSRAREVQAALSRSFQLERYEATTTASIGVALGAAEVTRPEELLRNADIAMYHAKESSRGSIRVFDAEMQVRTARVWDLQTELRRALDRGELELLYQPFVSLSDGCIAGCEALVRWKRSNGELVSPSEFIPLAEEAGLIREIGEWVLRKACHLNMTWQHAGLRPIRMSVNVSARQLADLSFADTLKSALGDSRLDSQWLQLELTETALMGSLDATPASLYSLFCMGIPTAIDDFGTGYSSFDYLRRFRFDELKIDRSFIADIGTDRRSAALVRSMISMAHTLDLNVVAEGVEDERQLDELRFYRCDQMQGFLASPPVPADELRSMLRVDRPLIEIKPDGSRKNAPAASQATPIAPPSSLARQLAKLNRRTPVPDDGPQPETDAPQSIQKSS